MSAAGTTVYDYSLGQYVDVSDQVKHITVTEELDQISSADVYLHHIDRFYSHSPLHIAYGGRALFSGIIESQSDRLSGGAELSRFSSWKAKDAALRLEKRIVNRIFENETIEDMIRELLVQYPAGVGGQHIRSTGRRIEQVTFQYKSLYECIEELADIAGWRWYVDHENELHFFESDEGIGDIVFSTRSGGGYVRNMLKDTISLDQRIGDKTANRVWIIGAREASPNVLVQTYTGDGNNDLFPIAFEPNEPEVLEDGAPRIVEPDRGGSTEADYVYDKANRVLRRVAGPLPAGTQLQLSYRPTRQTIDYLEDTASMAQYGIYEKAIKDKRIVDKLAARSRGRSELRRHSTAIRTISFDTDDLRVQRGLRYRLLIPELGIDSFWLCTKVVTSIDAPDQANIRKQVTMEEVS